MNAKPIAYPILGHFYLSNRNSRNRTDLQPLSLLTTSKVATLGFGLAVNMSVGTNLDIDLALVRIVKRHC
ncbi:TPA: hypothetical protein ACQNX3_000930 [Streptococcus pyogenes]|uniref:hypothetical protein n=1 Tax=Streptococcus pyogenes TaxID=1314 RepID=UPI00109C61E6|nr:hypothetical protein [Streptococcus pyogenes]QQA64836.1 hypothetical protein JAN99_03390 [Streptococcus pyogenes]HEQ4680496.1 hypothetical protein [Streptococcus pyogenes]HEQ7718220.1 hypothetical protein [Streptococcus pyogenes]HEQ8251767.1 hypothetical protein [Streptococcus pyogenes]HEQ8278213.1 hypothetical protein [Streptococcus pyogenes]